MIPNITPEEKDWWDGKIFRHTQKEPIGELSPREKIIYARGFQRALLVVLAIVLCMFVISLIYNVASRQPVYPRLTPEEVMDDTLQFSHPIQEDSFYEA